jgi:glycosyltransferase involved in cell wall biosynthesis
MRKLLLIGSNTIHTYNYLKLVEDYFDEVLLITNEKSNQFDYPTFELSFNFKLKNLFTTVKTLRKQVRLFQPSIIHVHQVNSFAFYPALAFGKRKNMVITAWGSDILILPHKNFIWKAIIKYSLSKFSFFTADSVHLANEMKKLMKNDEDVLIANFGIELHESNEQKKNIFYSNRLHKPLYRIDKIIEAFYRFNIQFPDKDYKLVIGASGIETENLINLVKHLDLGKKVEFIGWVDPETNRMWYGRSRFYVSIPESDATSISLLEAMAYGCVPILSDLPSNKEWIVHEKNGIIVQNLDEEYLSKVLRINLEEAVRENKEIINRDGTKQANREKFLNLYDTILN